MAQVSAGSSSSGIPCNTGVTNTGKSLLGSIMQAAAIAVAVLNADAQRKMAKWQQEIAQDYLNIAKWYREFYNNTYRPGEDQELREAWAMEEYEPMYDVTIGRVRNYGRINMAGAASKAVRCTSPYCTGLRGAVLKDAKNVEATQLAAFSNMGYRIERAYMEAMNDVRWQRREQVLNRGRDMIAGNIKTSSLAAGIFGDLGQQAGAATGSALYYLGYNREKMDTSYPMLASMQGNPQGSYNEPMALQTQPVSYTAPMGNSQSQAVTSGYYRDSATGQYLPASGPTYQNRG